MFFILFLPYKDKTNWIINWKGDNKIITNSSCLTYNSNCFGTKQEKITSESNETHVDRKNPCKFPFKYYNTLYNSCTRNAAKGFWCATSVDANLNYQTWGFCNDLCPLEGMYSVLPIIHTIRF